MVAAWRVSTFLMVAGAIASTSMACAKSPAGVGAEHPSSSADVLEGLPAIRAALAREWFPDARGVRRVVYDGPAVSVVARLKRDDAKREQFVEALEDAGRRALSHPSERASLAECYYLEARTFDEQRIALGLAHVQVIDAATDAKITAIEDKARLVRDNPDASAEDHEMAEALLNKAASIRKASNEAWVNKAAEYYAVLDPMIVDRFARAWLRGRELTPGSTLIEAAAARLHEYEHALGEAKMREYLRPVERDYVGFRYEVGMFGG